MEFPSFQPADVDLLVEFLCGEVWPFHVDQRPEPDAVRRRVGDGYYDNTFWIVDGGRTVGLVRLMDLGEGTPLFDLRVRAVERGRGIGTAAVDWVTRYVFRRAGFVKEAHYREAWPAPAPHPTGTTS